MHSSRAVARTDGGTPSTWSSQSLKSGGPYGPYSIFSPRYGPYSKVGTYSIEDNIDLILAWVHTNRPPIRKTVFLSKNLSWVRTQILLILIECKYLRVLVSPIPHVAQWLRAQLQIRKDLGSKPGSAFWTKKKVLQMGGRFVWNQAKKGQYCPQYCMYPL